jgi:methyltransferase (TIGR00027 family)
MIVGALDLSAFGVVSPGRAEALVNGMGVRTKFFDDCALASTAAGARQVVILASGLDARAYRLPWPDGITVFELDQPDVISFKTSTLAALGAQPTATRRAIPIDLRDDWPQALRDNGFDAGVRTAWLAEGLLIYLPPEAQDQLFDRITALSAAGSVLATEHKDTKALTGEWAKELSDRSRRHGSDIDLSALFYTGARTAAGDHLREHGWQVRVLPNAQAYAAHGFDPPTDDLIAMVGDSGYLSAQRLRGWS